MADVEQGAVKAPLTDEQGSGTSNDEEARREALRKAGEAYFQKALEAKEKGADPFAVAPTPQVSKPEDPDLVAFGHAFESVKVYVYIVLYVLCMAASPVLIKGCFLSMQTPAILMFLHSLAVAGALWLASMYDVVDLGQLSVAGVRGAAVSAALWAVQALCTFSALHHNSVLFVVAWTSVVGELIEVVAGLLLGQALPPAPSGLLAPGVGGGVGSGQGPSGGPRRPGTAATLSAMVSNMVDRFNPEMRMLCGVAVGAVVVEIIFDGDTVWLGFMMMGFWTAARIGEVAWRLIKSDPQLGGRITGFRLPALIRELADEEAALTPGSASFLGHGLPAVPVLIAGFLALEGRELVNHELSVPAVRLMLLAITCYVTAQLCGLLLIGRLAPSTAQALRSVAFVIAVVGYSFEEVWKVSWLAAVASIAACMAALTLALLRSK
mmetsp:Transcript_2363/g.5923  ORF Transcript_2363/g.5923 Transcript_2363/m.5923 type:complete len:437 (-) Transcript_2363:115-1425(-)